MLRIHLIWEGLPGRYFPRKIPSTKVFPKENPSHEGFSQGKPPKVLPRYSQGLPRRFSPRKIPLRPGPGRSFQGGFSKENPFHEGVSQGKPLPRRFSPRETPQGPPKVLPRPSKKVLPTENCPAALPSARPLPPPARPLPSAPAARPLPPATAARPSAPRKFLTFLISCSSWWVFRVDSSFVHYCTKAL